MADVVSEETGGQLPAKPEDPSFFRPGGGEIVVNQRRFGLAYLVLAIGVGVAVGLAIVLIGRGSGHHTSVSEGFRPTQSGELGAKQIARHVGPKYRQADGSPLAAVVGERPNYKGQPLSFYLIFPHDAQDPNKDIAVFPVGNGIMYAMCAFGKNCATPATETEAQAELLKREALELSTTTFKSDADVQTVTTLLPPLQQGGTIAVIFKRNDLGAWLHRPLSALLPGSGPQKPGKLSAAETQRIDTLEAGSLYTYDAVQGPDGNSYLRLDPIG